MAAHKPVFVAITSNSCGHCHVYRANQREKIAEHLRDGGVVEMVEIHTETMDPNSIGDQYHPDFKKLIGWFPIFFVFTGDSWNDHSKPLIGDVLGGYIKNGTSQNVVENRPRHDFDGIVGWINDTIKDNKYSTGTKPARRGSSNKRLTRGAKNMGSGAGRNQGRGGRKGSIPRSGRVPPRNPNITPIPDRSQANVPGSGNRVPVRESGRMKSEVPDQSSKVPDRSQANVMSSKSSRRNLPPAGPQPKYPTPGPITPGRQSLVGNSGHGPMTAPMPINRGPTSTLRLPPPPSDNTGGNAGLPPAQSSMQLQSGNNPFVFNNGNSRSVQGTGGVLNPPLSQGSKYMFRPSIIPTGPH